MYPHNANAVGKYTSSGAQTRSNAGHKLIPSKCFSGNSSIDWACFRLSRHHPGNALWIADGGMDLERMDQQLCSSNRVHWGLF
mmetsp:Transcript_1691/g.2172  ORF Transcript_1691/g.2172 Transcript_1691/m.2172 type:complete len:83 (+) Transcript_1691:2000-2248(+)